MILRLRAMAGNDYMNELLIAGQLLEHLSGEVHTPI
jgi:hypothetical protein